MDSSKCQRLSLNPRKRDFSVGIHSSSTHQLCTPPHNLLVSVVGLEMESQLLAGHIISADLALTVSLISASRLLL